MTFFFMVEEIVSWIDQMEFRGVVELVSFWMIDRLIAQKYGVKDDVDEKI